jgi:hypothetical protein
MRFLLMFMLALAIAGPLAAQGGRKGSKTSNTVTVEGSYRSIRGVMNALSCHCYDGGYITTDSGDRIAVCFENKELDAAMDKDPDMRCDRLRVTGVYKDSGLESDGNNPCPSGSMRYLKVIKWHCSASKSDD